MDSQTETIINIINNPSYAGLFFALTVWALVWKGMALWRASQNKQKKWFIALLILNTFGILEIVYLFYFSRSKENH